MLVRQANHEHIFQIFEILLCVTGTPKHKMTSLLLGEALKAYVQGRLKKIKSDISVMSSWLKLIHIIKTSFSCSVLYRVSWFKVVVLKSFLSEESGL